MTPKQTKLLEQAITDLGFVNCDTDRVQAVIELLNEVIDDG